MVCKLFHNKARFFHGSKEGKIRYISRKEWSALSNAGTEMKTQKKGTLTLKVRGYWELSLASVSGRNQGSGTEEGMSRLNTCIQFCSLLKPHQKHSKGIFLS